MPEADLAELQRGLVADLERNRSLTDPSVAMAFLAVPRHRFLPGHDPRSCYRDQAIPLKASPALQLTSSASQPGMMALMLEQLDLRAGMNVLEIGTASGFNAALIKRIVGPGGRVTSLEIDPELQAQAQAQLRAAGYADVLTVNQDGAIGYAARAPYDRIIATASVGDLPRAWLEQLSGDGILVAPLWLDGFQVSAAFRKQADGSLYSRDNRPCAFLAMRGPAVHPQASLSLGNSMTIMADDLDGLDAAALAQLLAGSPEQRHLGSGLRPEDYWHGLQPFLMLHAAPPLRFATYTLDADADWPGPPGNGLLLVQEGSLALAPYEAGGAATSYGDGAAFAALHSLCQSWRSCDGRLMDRLRLRMTASANGCRSDLPGKRFLRFDHRLQVWLA